MYLFHKLITYFSTPFTLGLAMLAFALSGAFIKRRILHSPPTPFFYTFGLLSLLWLWLWSTALMTRWIGMPLEASYPPVAAESMPMADAICILGGGMAANTNNCVYPEMSSCADRTWHGARLYKAGKAPFITLSGGGVRESTVPLLKDFGVPESAIVFLEQAKNTEEEAKLISSRLKFEFEKGGELNSPTPTLNSNLKPKVLLVTSAWHMRRAEFLFRRTGLDVVPAPADHEVTLSYKDLPFDWGQLIPSADCLFHNTYLFKEHFAYWCYRVRDWGVGSRATCWERE